MKPCQFDYINPLDVNEVLDALHDLGDRARIIAGGLSMGAMLNYRLVEPEVLIDISRLEELSYIRLENNYVEVGASTTQAELLAWPELDKYLPLLFRAMPYIGHYQTRSRGTVCGSICHSEPSSELPLCFATLAGEAVLKSKRGQRLMKAADFQNGMMSNARNSNEIISAVRFPIAKNNQGYAFKELARRSGDFAIVAVAACISGDNTRVGVGGVVDKPFIKDWKDLSEDKIDDELNRLAWELGGYSDIHANDKYRRRLVRLFGKQVIEEAKSNAII